MTYKRDLPDIKNVSNETLNSFIRDQDFYRNGSFGSVERALWGRTIVAIKHFKNRDHYIKNYHELAQLGSCNFEHIVKVIGAGPNLDEKKVSYFIMEFADSGSLDYILHKTKPQIHYTLAQALNWAYQCGKAVEYLHTRESPIIHRDLKPGNLLLFNKGRLLKLCDFGTTKVAHTENTAECGTYLYMAPEVMLCLNDRRKAKYDVKCDVFSWTIILWELLTRSKPYAKINSVAAIVWRVLNDHLHLEDIPNCPPLLKTLIDKGWHYNPKMRPPMQDIVEIFDLIVPTMPGVNEPLKNLEPFRDLSSSIPSPSQSCVSLERPSSSGPILFPQHTEIVQHDRDGVPGEELRDAYLTELKQSCQIVNPIEGDRESEMEWHHHKALQEEYLNIRYRCDVLPQAHFDLLSEIKNLVRDQDRLARVNEYCKLCSALEELQESR